MRSLTAYPDKYISILDSIIYNSTLEPADAFNFYKSKFCKQIYEFDASKIPIYKCRGYSSIIRAIIYEGRIDYIKKLCDDNIYIHTGKDHCACVLHDIIKDKEYIKYLDMMINYGWDCCTDKIFGNILFDTCETIKFTSIVLFIIDKCDHDKDFVLEILKSSIWRSECHIAKIILESMDNYQITIEILNNVVLEVSKKYSITGSMLKILENYGFDLDAHKGEIFFGMLEHNNNPTGILYLLSSDSNFNDKIYDKFRAE